MAVAQWPFVAAALLLVSSGLLSSSPLPACPEPCTCQSAPQLNCSSSGLSLVPQHIQDSVTMLDLSHNLLVSVTLDRQHHNLRNVWLGNNSITRLSLCLKRDLAGRHVRGRQLHRLKPWSRHGCVSWAPTLQLLSVERNQLEELPEGLEATESLQVLQLSFNRISTLQPGDLSHLWQLKELHLQHNLITSLHPQMFQDLAQLRVLDLSFNMVTNLHPLTYLSLRNIGADVRLDGNRWQCDCSMRSLQRRMAYDSSRGLQSWSVVCASPSILSGRDLVQLEEDDLNCFGSENRPELHQDVTVYSGSEILLSCSAQDSMWWTPSGQASVNQPQDGLLITDITERDTGLYVCVSEDHEVVSVFNLQISKIEGTRRKPRSLPQGAPNTIGQERNQRATRSDLTLAVCLSVFITFLIAFILGVLARPCIDILWKRVTKKKRSTETNSVSDVEQRQYDNEAFSNGEEPEVPNPRRERRVTFSDVDIRENNVQYYDTVASGDQESLNDDAVFECEAAKVERDGHTAEDSGSESSLRQSSPEENQRDLSDITNAGRKHNIEFEHIPDPVEQEKRRSSSSSSDSSLSGKEDRITLRDLTTPKSPQLAKDSVQQRADFLPAKVEGPPISTEGSEILGFSSEPFSDWSPHTKNPNLTDPDLWQENDEQFEFSDSVRSISPRSSSVCGSFNDSKPIVAPTINKQKRDDTSSSSSYVSDGEPTEYTVNSDQVKEEDIESNHNKPEVTIMPSVGLNQGDYRYDTQRPAARPKHSFSSHSSDSDGEDHTVKKETGEGDTKKKIVPMPRTNVRVPSLGVINHGKGTRAPPPPVAHASSSSSESEAEIKDLKVEQKTGRVNEGIKISEPKVQSTKLDPQIKRSFDIKASSAARPKHSFSSHSSDSDGEDHTVKKETDTGEGDTKKKVVPMPRTNVRVPSLGVINHGKSTRAPPPPVAHSSPLSSESEAEIKDLRVEQKTGRVNEGIKISEPKIQSTKLDPQIKRSLDIKAPLPASDSTSSDESTDESRKQTKRQGQGDVDIAGLPIKEYQSKSNDAMKPKWPSRDLNNVTPIKAPSPASDSSSSSDSEAETIGHRKKQEQGQTNMARLPIKVSQTASHDPQTQWPVLDLEHTTRIKRRLDIKVPSPASESSSSSDSKDEKIGHIKKREQGQANMAKLPIKVSQTNVKAPRPESESSSSSDSEAEKMGQKKKQVVFKVDSGGNPFQVSQTVKPDLKTQWPVLDLGHTTRIKRRLDIKAPSPDSESSSSNSDSEDEKTGHIKKQEQGQTNMVKPPIKVSQPNIKAPRADSDSSSSSDSEAETTGQKKKQEQWETNTARLPIKVSQTASRDPQTQWPVLDLEHTTRIKRRLDIKVPSPASESSSSSDSEDEKTGHIKKREQGQANMAKLPIKVSQTHVKAPRPDSESSSSSDSEAEKTGQKKKQILGKLDSGGLPFQVSQTVNPDLKTQWPVLDLEHTTRIKRRLDIKAPSPDSESSSSNSDSEDVKTGHIKKQEQGQTNMVKPPIKVSQPNIKAPKPDSDSSSSSDSEAETTGQKKKQVVFKVDSGGNPFQVSQTVNPDLKTQWPVLDLGHTTRIKRRLDIKVPSPASESSSSSDSEDEKTGHIKKQEQGQANMARLPIKVSQTNVKAPRPESESSSSSDSEAEKMGQKKKQMLGKLDSGGHPFQVSQTVNPDLKTQWPVLDLGHTTRIKRRLDIKAPSPDCESSSSNSDSEDVKTGHIKKQEQGQTNMVKPPIKVSQPNIKAPKPDSDSSSSSDSEAETTGQKKKQEQWETNTARLPIKVSQTASRDPQTQWPVLDLEHTTRIKRRLDIKVPSPASESSSSSDSEDEKTGHIKKREQGQANMAKLPIKVSQTNVKAPRPESESSSSSDSEAETTGQKKKQILDKLDSGGNPFQVSQTVNPDLQTQWPVLDLEHTTRIKRRLDIKAPSPDSESSSSSNSEREDVKTSHIKKQEQGQTNMVKPPIKVSQPNIKAPRADSDSSSSSDSEAETTGQKKKREQWETNTARLPIKVSQTASHDPQIQWPVLDLEHTTRIKRRLDIKAPSPASESSSSSDSEDEKTGHIKKREQGQANMAKLPIKVSQTNVKAQRPESESSSSSDSEAETTGQKKKQILGKLDSGGLPIQASQTVNPDLKTQWPVLDLGHTTRIKRRLDIKVPSPASEPSSSSDSEDEITGHIKRQEQGQTNMARLPITAWQPNIKPQKPDSESSSSSDSETETTGHIKKQEQGQINMASRPIKASRTASNDPQTQWPLLDLEHTARIKRRMDIKAPSPDSESSSSSDSENKTTGHTKKQEKGQTNMVKPPIKVSQTKVKAPTPDSESSSSSDSEAETTGQIEKHGQGQTNMASLPIKVSQTAYNDPQTQWPVLDLGYTTRIKRRLDIKAPSPASESSSSSEDETTHHTKKERPELLVIAGLPFKVSQTENHDPEKQWPAVDLGNTTRIRRRLDIKAPSPTPQSVVSSGREGKREEAIKMSSSSSSSSSDEQEEGMQGFTNPPRTAEPDLDPDSRWPRLGLSSAPHVKRRLDIRASSPSPISSGSNESEGGSSDLPVKVERDRTTVGITSNTLETKLPDLDRSIPLVKRRLDIKAPSPEPNTIQSRVSHGSQQSTSSSSDSEDDNRDHTKLGLGASTISKATEKKFNWSPKIPVLHTRSPKTDHDIKLSKYTVFADGVGDKTSDNINTAPVITPELESRWASMNLGISRFRKRIESHESTNQPPSPPPDSPTSRTRRKRWGVGIGEVIHTQSPLTPEKASPSLMGQDDNSVEVKERLRKDYSPPKTEEKSTTLTSFGDPHFRKYLDIKLSEKAPDTIDHSGPDLSLGVQRTNRSMNVKAPSSESSSSSSSSSENEHEGTGYTAKQSRHPSDTLGVTDNNSLITYKCHIFSDPTTDRTNQRHTGAEIVSVAQEGPLHSVRGRDESLAPRRVPSMNFDDVVRKRIEQSKHTTDVDLPPEIRWTGIGRQPSDLSISSTRRQLDTGLSSPSAQPELLHSFNYSSDKSDGGTLMHKYSSLSANSGPASSRALDKFDNLPDSLKEISSGVPEERREKKGLSALKAMSSARQKWDTQAENLDKGSSPLFDDRGPQVDSSFYNRRPEKVINPPEKRATDSWYEVPRYRRHNIGGIEPPQETPPPIPATPPPDEAVELQWGSPQSSMKQGFAGTRPYLQQNRNRVESNPSLITSVSLEDYFDPTNTNISHV